MPYLLAEANRGLKVEYKLDVIGRFEEYEDADEQAEDRFHMIYKGPSTQIVRPDVKTHEPIYRYALLKDGEFYKIARHHEHAKAVKGGSIHEDLEIVFCDRPIDRDARELPSWEIDWSSQKGIGDTLAERLEDASSGFRSVEKMLFSLDEIKHVGEKTRNRLVEDHALYDWEEIVDKETAIQIEKQCRDIDSIEESMEKSEDLFPEEHHDEIYNHLYIEKEIL